MSSSCIHFNGNLDNVERLLSSPRAAVASDSLLVGERPHPRGWGTFARFLQRYSLSSGRIPLEEAVRRITRLPASVLGLTDRGILRPRAVADVCCFDPATVRDNATFEEPRRLASGFHHVLVRGTPVIAGGEPTGALPGRVVRRPDPSRVSPG
jgi:N-acyl-D-amino-acid deacylase